MSGAIRSESRANVRIVMCAFAALSLFIAACSGGGGNEAPITSAPQPQPVGGLVHCDQDTLMHSAAAARHLAVPAATATPAPTNFASCLKSQGADVEVGGAGCPSPVLVESSATAGTITVDAGASLMLGDTTLTLNTTGIVVNGLMEACFIGQNSLTNQVTINFTGGKSGGHSDGITVNSGGILRFRGVKGSVPEGGTSWTALSCPAGPASFGPGNGVASPVLGSGSATCPGGPLTIQVAASVAKDWQPGDWIVVSTTDFVEHNSEFVQIQSLATTTGVAGTTITLNSNTPLTQYHFGGAAPDSGSKALTDDFTKNYGIDERAEVGLITRNIKLTSSSPDLHVGGEIDLQPGSLARLWGAEIEKFGKPQLGSYPVNFIGAVTLDPPPLNTQPRNVMDSDSIHHSYNHGIVLGSAPATAPGSGSGGASGLNFANNVVARVAGHLFYLTDGNEVNNQFINNLGLAAMSNSYTIPPSTDALAPGYTSASAAAQFFWVGDYLTNNPSAPPCALTNATSPCNDGYDGFNIPNTDCDNSNAWASGFYITNPHNTFSNNSIGGCQGQGRGFWYLPFPTEVTPPPSGTCPSLAAGSPFNYTCNTQQLAANAPFLSGLFANNRAHACYTGLDTAPDSGTNNVSIVACPLAPQFNHNDVYTQIEGMTATRNRNRGIWVRPGWYVVDNARVATNRDSITVVSSGGTEGSPPGEWSVVSNSILAGISANNPRRFGPCPYPGQGAIAGGGGNSGCVDEDQVTGPAGGHGYPVANWNLEGEMLYDGPARLTGNVFVNFLANPASYLTAADQGYLGYYEANNRIGTTTTPFVYEGDAAFGWFQSNINSYPPTQYSENDTFNNTDLRHQVYTADVNLAAFADGDKNTVLLDQSPTASENLAGYQVVAPGCTAPCSAIANKSAISFNNLPFVSTPNSVDECLSEGQQDTALENRPTALMSPQDYATLEFSMQTTGAAPSMSNATCPGSPTLQNCNNLTFAKDQLDFGGAAGQQTDGIAGSAVQPVVDCPSTHSCINLVGRNQTGVYEPKVINSAGYTVMSTQGGIQPLIDVTFTDASVAGGITSRMVSDAAITAGDKMLSSATAAFTQADVGRQVLIVGAGSSTAPNNPNLFSTIASVQGATGATLAAPAGTTVSGAMASIATPFGVRLSICYKSANGAPASAASFAVTTGLKSLAQPFPGTNLKALSEFWNQLSCNGLDLDDPSYITNCFSAPPNQNLTALDPGNQLPLATALAQLDPTHYYYNSTTGLLTIMMQQISPNGAIPTSLLPFGGGPSPLASCGTSSSDPCPDAAGGETFYSCPEGGCPLYTVDVTDTSYKPGLSSCVPYGTSGQDYTAPWPTNLNRLAYLDGTPITTTAVTSNVVNGTNFPHITDNNPIKACAASPASATPPWIGTANPASSDVTFTLGLPKNVCILSISPAAAPLSSNGTALVPLASKQSYTFNACDGANQCSQSVSVTGTSSAPAFTAATGSCGIPPSGTGTIPFAAGFTAGKSCTCPS